jgi:hypothetical protein
METFYNVVKLSKLYIINSYFGVTQHLLALFTEVSSICIKEGSSAVLLLLESVLIRISTRTAETRTRKIKEE